MEPNVFSRFKRKDEKYSFGYSEFGIWMRKIRNGFLSRSVARTTLRTGDLEEVLLKGVVFWRQKSRFKCVREGNCNSNFFFLKVANGLGNGKFIKYLASKMR